MQRELEADNFAIRYMGESTSLKKALLKVSALEILAKPSRMTLSEKKTSGFKQLLNKSYMAFKANYDILFGTELLGYLQPSLHFRLTRIDAYSLDTYQ